MPDPLNVLDYYETTTVTLGPDNAETDLSWDAGLWRPLPAITIDKVTKDTSWPDAAARDGSVASPLTIEQGADVTWIYTITNPGNTRLENVKITDDGGPAA